ncbi:MAG TPA: hypothetical protein ENI74_04530, partial [Gammaproteobacteria bacterium]|nr:hypothetical protein [Gammaproteobacteria bacterium]
MRSMTIVLILAASLLGGCNDSSTVYTAIKKLSFADATLATCVREAARENGWSDAGHVDRLQCVNTEGKQVTDLSGIEQLVNLEELDLAHNAIA